MRVILPVDPYYKTRSEYSPPPDRHRRQANLLNAVEPHGLGDGFRQQLSLILQFLTYNNIRAKKLKAQPAFRELV